jgi:HPt (histidine-containing phosphotransfer) domain-containing protein
MSEVASPSGIDLDVLAALEKRLGRGSMVGLIAAHLRHAKAVCDRLQAMAGMINREELQSIGHQIVGSCGSIGLNGLSDLGSTLEDEAMQAPPETLQQIIAATLNACAEVRAILAERYPEVAV